MRTLRGSGRTDDWGFRNVVGKGRSVLLLVSHALRELTNHWQTRVADQTACPSAGLRQQVFLPCRCVLSLSTSWKQQKGCKPFPWQVQSDFGRKIKSDVRKRGLAGDCQGKGLEVCCSDRRAAVVSWTSYVQACDMAARRAQTHRLTCLMLQVSTTYLPRRSYSATIDSHASSPTEIIVPCSDYASFDSSESVQAQPRCPGEVWHSDIRRISVGTWLFPQRTRWGLRCCPSGIIGRRSESETATRGQKSRATHR